MALEEVRLEATLGVCERKGVLLTPCLSGRVLCRQVDLEMKVQKIHDDHHDQHDKHF
jgi:hypothetical protein